MPTTPSYTVFSMMVSVGQSVDLSPFFSTPGVAETSYQNTGWQFGIQDELTPLHTGTVNQDGSLNPTSGFNPPQYSATSPLRCNGVAQLRITYTPKPDKSCGSCPCDSSGNCSTSASDATSNSVELATGNFIFKKDLLSLAGLGAGSWKFGLNYKSNFGIDGILGKNFAYPQYMHLEQMGSSAADGFQKDVQLITDGLSQVLFTNNSGVFTPQAGTNSRASLKVMNQFTANEQYVLTAFNGTITTFYGFSNLHPVSGSAVSFPAPGQIKSMVDRYGNTLTFNWSNSATAIISGITAYTGSPQLLSVTDAYGRVVNYSYYGEECDYQLQQITDPFGRQLNFQYDGENHLSAVITPAVSKAASGNTFLGGSAYVFQFDLENANPARRDDLIKIWYPNEVEPYLDVDTRTVNVQAVYENATPRYQITYGQALNDPDSYGKVMSETLGDPENEIGGTSTFAYLTFDSSNRPTNIIDTSSAGTLISRTTYSDRNGNRKIYDFNSLWTTSRFEEDLNRSKCSLEITPVAPPSPFPTPHAPPYITWTKYDSQNQPTLIVYPEGNSAAYTYDDGLTPNASGDATLNPYIPRVGLLLSESRMPGNSIGIPSRSGSGSPTVQNILTKRYFYEPIYQQLCAVIDERGNPINGTTYFTPQNGGTTPTDSDRSRYATTYTFDYQKDQYGTITGNSKIQTTFGLSATQIGELIDCASNKMTSTGGTGGLPTGFLPNSTHTAGLGDINADGTGNGASSGLPAATPLGNVIQITRPSVLLVGGTTQPRIELFTVNNRGQITTATDPEGNLTVTTRYPANDPEGSGQSVSSSVTTQQYGLTKSIHRDANPDDVMSLVGASGDLVAFVPGATGTNTPARTNTPGVYQNLVTRYEGTPDSSMGCVTCAYDPMGNVLSETDPRGFTTVFERNEIGEIYRTISAAPYSFRTETYFDANRNVVRVDTEDWQVQYNSSSPTNAGYGTFTPSDSGPTTQVPMISGPGGQLRLGWFSNLMSYDLLDNKIEEDIDATGSPTPDLITRYEYDANQNLTKIIKPEGNTVEYDYDERDLKIAERVGYNPAVPGSGAVTGYSYDGNRNLINIVGPSPHIQSPYVNTQTVFFYDAFGSGEVFTLFGDWVLQNVYDGFDRVIMAIDALGGQTNLTYDPTSAVIQRQVKGQVSGYYTGHGGANNTLLSSFWMNYDEARRMYEEGKDVFLPYYNVHPNLLPSGRVVTHTGGGLATNSTANNHTGTVTLTATSTVDGGSSYVLTRTIYDRAGRIVATLADNTAETDYTYDGANRQILVTDPKGNTVATLYDGNSNAIQVTKTDVCTIASPTVANEIFISFTWFDCLNRPVVTGTQGEDGNLSDDLNLCCPWQGLPSTLFSLMGYDSRGNKTTVTDPKGNVVLSIYDGASRLIETQQEMRIYGDGSNKPAPNQTFLTTGGGIIRTEYVYDGNSRLIELVDDRGASIYYTYDLLDRLITRTLADGSVSTRVYDASGCLTNYTDENGSSYLIRYDCLSRKATVNMTLATGVNGTNSQTFYFSSLGNCTEGWNNGGGIYAATSYTKSVYDSLSRMIETYHYFNSDTPVYTTYTAWTSWKSTQLTYPTGTIVANSAYDELYRRNSVTGLSGATTLDTVDWQFFGPQRIVETNFGSDSLIATQMNNARTHSAVQSSVPLPAWGDQSSDRLGYDGARRMITKRYLTGGIDGGTGAYNNTTALVGDLAAYDRTGNKLYERHLEAETRSHLYQTFDDNGNTTAGYDSANRLTQYQRGSLDSSSVMFRTGPGYKIATPITLPGTNQAKTYGLDGLGNWKTSNFTAVGSGGSTTLTAEVRQHNYVNEITSIKDSVGGPPPTVTTTGFTYDHGNNAGGAYPLRGNGNITSDGVRLYEYDVLNRLISVKKPDGTVLAYYYYDAFNRRMRKILTNGGLTGDIPNGTYNYYYDGQQIIEERDNSTGAWIKVKFWGQYIDELLFFTVPTTTTYRVLSDLLYRSTALVDTSNTIVEAYDTDAYGNTLCYSDPGTDSQWFTDDDVTTHTPINTTIFTGRDYDPETQIYYYRARYYSPNIGRFLQRDPLGSVLIMDINFTDRSTIIEKYLTRLHWGIVDFNKNKSILLEWLNREPLRNAELRQSPNLYCYVINNPARYMDPLGEVLGEGTFVGGLVGGFVGGVLGLTAALGDLAGYDAYAALNGLPPMSSNAFTCVLQQDVGGGIIGGAVVGAVAGTIADPDPVGILELGLGGTAGATVFTTNVAIGGISAAQSK